uniref:Uncharacterized protein n=1 Tax=viral metagenome TaxID=1070528 RepID=A0A6H1ZAX4_9ZZZZ
MALNKQQALAKKRRDTLFGEKQGEITKGLKPGDRYYDDELGGWQIKPEVEQNLDGYLDTIIDASGMNGNAQGSASGNTGTGSSGGGKQSGTSEDPDPNGEGDGDQDDNGNWIIPAAVAAGGATAIAAWLASRKKGNKSGAANPAIDDAGEADKGGAALKGDDPRVRGTYNAGDSLVGLPAPDDIIEGIYTEVGMPAQVEGPRAALPAPVGGMNDPDVMAAYEQGQSGSVIPMGNQAAASNPELPPEMKQLAPPVIASPVDDTIANIDGPDGPLADPEMERGLQDYAARLREQMKVDPFAMDRMRAGETGDMPNSIMRRLRAIIASGP